MINPSAERFRSDLIALLDEFGALTGRADTSICRAAFQTDKDFAQRIRSGANFTMEKAVHLERFLRNGLAFAKRDRERFDTWFADLYERSLRPKSAPEPVAAGAE